MNNVIEINGLYFSYGKREVLRNLSLTVKKSEIVCLMGANGCGKTTLIDTVMGLNKFAKGEIFLDGEDIKTLRPPAIAKKIAFVPQLHTITFPYTVKEIVTMGRTAYSGLFGSPKKADGEIALDALKKVGIADFADRPYSQLSGGEITLVLLARALSQRSDVIIMDEPTAHLDMKNELVFLETVGKLVAEENTTVLLATHSPDHAFYFERQNLSVKAALMKDGVIASIGVPSEIITEQSLSHTFGVRADIITNITKDGREEKSVILRNTL